MKTGYFANASSFTKVHIVDDDEQPVCGSNISKGKVFQWCSMRVALDYIECEHCKKWWKRTIKRR